jgi:hypothetical protein
MHQPWREPIDKRSAALKAMKECLSFPRSDGAWRDEAIRRVDAARAELSANDGAIASLCEIARLVLDELSGKQQISFDAERRILVQVASGLLSADARNTGIDRAQLPGSKIAAAAMTAVTKSETLSLRDGRRLGEILQRLATLSPEALEMALRYQENHGGKLGDALVRLALIDQRELDHALRIQDRERRPHNDHWAPRLDSDERRRA